MYKIFFRCSRMCSCIFYSRSCILYCCPEMERKSELQNHFTLINFFSVIQNNVQSSAYLFEFLSIASSLNFLIEIFFQAEDGIRDCLLSRGLGDVYKRQRVCRSSRYSPDSLFIWLRCYGCLPLPRLRYRSPSC